VRDAFVEKFVAYANYPSPSTAIYQLMLTLAKFRVLTESSVITLARNIARCLIVMEI
jgi:hypothetical protein